MKNTKQKVILIGAGMRGMQYTDIMKDNYSDFFEVVAVAEPLEDRREYVKNKHNISSDNCFETFEPLLEKEKFADIAIIANMDRDHTAAALMAIEKGYNLLLEKPIAPTPEECIKIQEAADKKGVFALVCHVLRFTPFFTELKNILTSGEIGEITNITHTEGVGAIHQSQSFVRGNWSNSKKSSVMLLQKSCHDMDILAYLIGKPCKKVQSFGSLNYFVRENAPEGSPERCMDGCPVGETCIYNTEKHWRNGWFKSYATGKTDPTDQEVLDAISKNEYGKCVFKCNNDVVDRQVVNLEFEDGICVNFTMSAFNVGGRDIRIMGTKGEIVAKMTGNEINIYRFLDRKWEKRIADGGADQTIVGGHAGGDFGIIAALKDYVNGKKPDAVCSIKESLDNHMIVFAAEESRLNDTVVSLEEYKSRF